MYNNFIDYRMEKYMKVSSEKSNKLGDTPGNDYRGKFTSNAKRDEFLAITNIVNQGEFQNETGLTDVKLSNVKTIGSDAFHYSPLETLLLPQIITIGDNAFSYSHLLSVSFPNATTIGNSTFSQSPLTSLLLPKATDIGYLAFGSIVNVKSTFVTMKFIFNNDKEKD